MFNLNRYNQMRDHHLTRLHKTALQVLWHELWLSVLVLSIPIPVAVVMKMMKMMNGRIKIET